MDNAPYDLGQLLFLFRKSSRPRTYPLHPLLQDGPFEAMLAQSNTCCYSVDYRTGQYLYLSPSIKRLLGYERSAWQLEGVQSLLRLLHADDRKALRDIHKEALRTIHELPIQQRRDLSFTYAYRITAGDGRELLLSNHSVFLTFDAAGEPLSDFTVMADITPFKPHYTRTLFVKQLSPQGEVPYRTVLFLSGPAVHFSRRELEVLYLVAQGYTSEEISRCLFISYYTVCGHRKNLLHKAGTKRTVELLAYARRWGLIE